MGWKSRAGEEQGGCRRHRTKQAGGTVKGTFDDLSDDEKTKAFLQLLEYKLRMEKEQRTEKKEKERKENSFHELWQRLPTHQIDPVSETEEEKTVRQSIQVWYGIHGSGSDGFSSCSTCAAFILLLHVVHQLVLHV